MPEYPPLLAPGLVDIAIADLETIFVAPFPDHATRLDLVVRLRRFIGLLQGLGITGALWVDGSFVTKKPHPGDIDAVLLIEDAVLQGLNAHDLDSFRKIIHNNRDTKLRHGCDLYFCDPADPVSRSYWRGWFGFDRNEAVKGIARLAI